MTAPPPEFCRPVPLGRIGPDGFRQTIEATAEERERLARRFGLMSLDRLTATVDLKRGSGTTIALEAAFEAEFVQECVVSLEPVRDKISQSFALCYGPPGEAAAEIELDADEIAFEPLDGDAIDIGEAVAQELSLTLPPFPRDPEAVLEDTATAKPEESAFAALARWRSRERG
ncbi:MAG TPA: DUF177 domain-containing protein [Stellaceae bacterium]|nr:DUF177 domain-containing protein [Stellaceae bacterium]